MKRFSQTVKVVLALFVAVFSNGLLPTTAAYAAQGQNPPGNNGTLKVHEIGTPSGTESNDPKVCSFNFEGFGFDNGQTGFINIDKQQSNTTYGPYTVGPASSNGYFISQDFNTQSGVAIPNGSYKATMYGKDTPYGQPTEKAKSKIFKVECAPKEVSAATVVVNDPCDKKDDSFLVPVTDHVTYTYKIGNGQAQAVTEGTTISATAWSQTYTVTAIADSGYILSGSATQTFQFTNCPCLIVIQIPEAPKPNDPCGLNNATWVAPKDTDSIHWSIVNGHLIATAQDGYIFSGNKTSNDYGVAPDSGKLCVIDKPQKPEVDDPCGPHNAHWIMPNDTEQIDWSLNNQDELIATAKPGYVFENGQHSINYGKAHDSNTPCVKTIPLPEAPKPNDPCGLNNARWIVPQDTFKIDWSLNNKGELIATAKPGYIFENEEHSHNFGKAQDSGKLCPTKPETPKFIDYCGTRTDYVVIPSVKGVTYKIDGVKVNAGYHAVSGTVTVTAVAADEDYVLVGDEKGPWTHEFSETECVTITKTSQPVTDTNGDGGIGVGDTVTWNITVTNNSDNDLDNFRIELTDSSATIADNDYVTDGVIKYLKHGTSVSVTATSTLTVDDVKACKATNIVEFQGWYTRKHHEIDKNGHEENNVSLRHGDYNDNEDEDGYDLSGSAEAQALFTCPTPGSGGSGSQTPTETPSEETPAVLPSTGPANSGSPLMAIIAAVVAYGATYFMQRRRELASNN